MGGVTRRPLICGAAAAAVAAPLAAAGGNGAGTVRTAVRPDSVVTCATHIEGRWRRSQRFQASRDDFTVSRRVVLAALRRAEEEDPESFGPRPDGTDAGWKAAATIRYGRAVTISIAPEDRERAALDYDRSKGHERRSRVEDADAAQKFKPCRPSRRRFSDDRPIGRFTSWAGGFVLAGPGCVGLDIQFQGKPRALRRYVAFGTPRSECPRP
jgi:hypothetical protein